MSTIKSSFQRIVEVQRRIGYEFPSILNSPAGFDLLNDIQHRLDINFSHDLLELYLFANGTNEYNKPLGLAGLMPLYLFMDLTAAEKYYFDTIKSRELFRIWGSGHVPGPKLFPFLQDSAGDAFWLDLNKNSSGYGRVFWTNTLSESPDYLFSSLADMFETIAQAYEKGIYYLDSDCFLTENFEEFARLAGKINTDIQYWVDFN